MQCTTKEYALCANCLQNSSLLPQAPSMDKSSYISLSYLVTIVIIITLLPLQKSSATFVTTLRKSSVSLALSNSRHFQYRLQMTESTNHQHSSDEDKHGFVDIGVNLLDPMYQGNYRGKERHEPDLYSVLHRSSLQTVNKLIITAGTLEESRHAHDLVLKLRKQQQQIGNISKIDYSEEHELPPEIIQFYSSVGIHPTRCSQEFGFSTELSTQQEETNTNKIIDKMRKLVRKGLETNAIVTFGELGLDYARTEFCPVQDQKKGLQAQLKLALEFPTVPLFIHNRDTGEDLYHILKQDYCEKLKFDQTVRKTCFGVVHSFDDTLELAEQFIELGMYIGINGCSLKTAENLETVKSIPLEKIVLETDGPWCDIRKTHAGYNHVKTHFSTKQEKKFEMGLCVKNRTEPCHLIQVAEIIAGVKGVSIEEVKNKCWKNTHALFPALLESYNK